MTGQEIHTGHVLVHDSGAPIEPGMTAVIFVSPVNTGRLRAVHLAIPAEIASSFEIHGVKIGIRYQGRSTYKADIFAGHGQPFVTDAIQPGQELTIYVVNVSDAPVRFVARWKCEPVTDAIDSLIMDHMGSLVNPGTHTGALSNLPICNLCDALDSGNANCWACVERWDLGDTRDQLLAILRPRAENEYLRRRLATANSSCTRLAGLLETATLDAARTSARCTQLLSQVGDLKAALREQTHSVDREIGLGHAFQPSRALEMLKAECGPSAASAAPAHTREVPGFGWDPYGDE